MFHQTNTLTTGTDTVTGTTIETITAGLDYTPGGNDRVNTLQSEDSITGGAGTSTTLNATIGNDNDNGSDVIAPTMTGVEIVNIRSTASDGAVDTLDFSSVSGVTAININQVLSDSFVVRNISEAASLSVSDVADDTASVAFEFTDTFVTGSLTTLTVTVDGFVGNQLNIGADANATTEGQNVEVLNLVASGDDSTIASLGSDDLTTLTLSGAADLTIAALTAGTSLLNVDASAMTGAATISLGAATENGRFTYSGSDGADTVTLTNGGDVIQASDSLSGGAGADTLVIRPATANDDVTSIGVSGTNASAASFETLTLRADDLGAADAVDFIVDLDHITGVTQINLITMETTTGNTFTLNDIGESTTGALTPVSVTLGGTALGDTDVTLDAADGAGNESIAMTVSVADDGHHVDIIDANANIETISVVVSGQFNAELDFSGDFAGDSSNDGSISISGHTAGRTLTVDDNAIVAETVNLTGLLSNASIVLGAADQTVTGGSGDDVLDFGANLDADDTIDGGAGTDVVRTAPGSSWAGSVALTNIETLRLEASNTVTTRFSDATTVTTVDLDAGAAINSNVVTVSGLTAITTISASAEAGTTLDDANGLTVLSGFAGTADVVTLAINTVEDTMTVGALTLTGLETLNISVTGDGDSNNATVGGITATTGLTSVTVSATGFATNATDHDIVLGSVGGNTTDAMSSFDASSLTVGVSATLDSMATGGSIALGSGGDDISIVGSAGTGLVITGGGGTDTITLTSTASHVITTGTGDATIVMGTGGSNSITLGTGDNSIDFDDGGAHGESSLNTISGFNSGDTIKLEDTTDTAIQVVTAKLTAASTAADYNADTTVFTLNASDGSALSISGTDILIADMTDVSDNGDVEVFLEALLGTAATSDHLFTVVLNDGTNSYIYSAFIDVSASGDEIAALDLVATVEGYIINGTTDLIL